MCRACPMRTAPMDTRPLTVRRAVAVAVAVAVPCADGPAESPVVLALVRNDCSL
jgi:hypothetical protein